MNDKQIIYSMSKVGKVYRQKHVLKHINLSYFYGAKIGVLGLNGAGKSSLLRIMAGEDTDHLGEVTLAKGYSVGLLPQEPALDPDKTVKETVQEGVQETVDLLESFNKLNNRFSEPLSDKKMEELLTKQAKLQDRLDAADAWDLDSRLDLAMESLRCPEPDRKNKHLSGGEKRRVALCRLLLKGPDILLLDEPTNHLDAETVWWLERHLKQYKGTVIAVTHDRYFLDNVAGWILELDRGEGIPFKGNYSSWLEQKSQRLAIEEKQESKRQKSLKEELEWIRSGPKARQAKSKARIRNYQERLQASQKEKEQSGDLYIPSGPRLGELVIEAQNITKSYDDKLLYENLNFKLPAGGIVGVIGPNGAGKTTLFRLITGEEKANSGTFKRGETVKISYVDQNRTMDPQKTIFQTIVGAEEHITLAGRTINARAYIARFNITGEQQQKKIGELSGGEKNRVHLAKLLQEEGNVLLLDEPTNDLDVNTLRSLEKALIDFPGCAVIISHDRYFIDRVATHILAFEGNCQVEWFEGNFSDYEEDKRRRLGDQALNPKRMTYKKLKRD